MGQNVAENDGLGNSIIGKAKSYVKHHAQARFAEYFLKEGGHNRIPRRGVQRHDFCPHLGWMFRVLFRRHAKQPHLFFAEMKFVCLFFFPTASKKRRNSTSRARIRGFVEARTSVFIGKAGGRTTKRPSKS